jgi:death-on-curing family protein
MWYPDKDFVVWVHDVMLERFGGFSGLERGLSCFDVILEKVKVTKGLYRKAAVLLREMSRCRIFADGNHRTAYEVTKTFLEMNGGKIKAIDLREVITFIKGIMHYDIDEIEAWLKYGTISKRS